MASGIINFITDLTVKITTAAWGLFLLTWSVGWLIRGAPIPVLRFKRVGQSLIEDAVWAAFGLAIGTSVFALIAYIAKLFGATPPKPP
ncbi:MAG: hypothetical protein GXO09_00190 [Crenarchaeota archaeon]|nr:hypothetical protein [Thermoproteota archaeon]